MRELHVVALSEDGKSVVLAATKGAQRGGFRVALDGPLTAAVRGEFSRPPQEEDRPSTITVKEIQARLRAGESPEEISRAEGIDLDRVQRFSGPVLSEIARVVESTRSAVIVRTRRGPSVATLGESVDEHLRRQVTAREESARWSARRQDDGRWVVEVVWQARGGLRTGRWYWDPVDRSVTAADPESAALGHLGTAEPRGGPGAGKEAAAPGVAERPRRTATGVRTAPESPAALARAALGGKRPLPEAGAVQPPPRRRAAVESTPAPGSAAARRTEVAATRRARSPVPVTPDDRPYQGGASAALRDPATVQRPVVSRTTVRPSARPTPAPADTPGAQGRGRRAVQGAAAVQVEADAAPGAPPVPPRRARTAALVARRAAASAAAAAGQASSATGATGPGPAAAERSRERAAAPVRGGGAAAGDRPGRSRAAAEDGSEDAAAGAGAATAGKRSKPSGSAPAPTAGKRSKPAASAPAPTAARRRRAAPAVPAKAGGRKATADPSAVAQEPVAGAEEQAPAAPQPPVEVPATPAVQVPADGVPAHQVPAAQAGVAEPPAPQAPQAPAAGPAADDAPAAPLPVASAGALADAPAAPDEAGRTPAEAAAPAARAPADPASGTPDPEAPAEQPPLKAAAGAEPAPPLLRVVRPPAGTARARPARERGRASVPAWADVLLGTSARPESDDDPPPG